MIWTFEIIVCVPDLIFQIDRPCLLENNRPTPVWKVTHVHVELFIVLEHVVPHKSFCCCEYDMIVLDQLCRAVWITFEYTLEKILNACFHLLKSDMLLNSRSATGMKNVDPPLFTISIW